MMLDWEKLDLARDAWLAATPAGDLVGYAAAKRWRDELECDLYAEPEWRGPDLGRALLARCEARAREVAQELGQDVVVRTYVPHTNRRMRSLAKGAGYDLVRYHFQMGVRLNKPPPAPAWPAGVAVRTAVPGQDEPAIHDLVEAAFARPGRTPTTLEEWKRLMLRADLFDPDLWFLAVAGESLVGVCLCFPYPGEAWVRQLAVAERWRRKGIASALLRHAFGVFRERGYDRAGLAVDSENPNAYAFYEQVGMHQVRQYDEYARALDLSH
jgi:ribosomal protein S18 acetylase RimI-like enzyme